MNHTMEMRGMVQESVLSFHELSKVVEYLHVHVSKRLPVACIRAYLYVVLAGGTCVCQDVLKQCGVVHDDLNRLLKSYKRSEKTGTKVGFDLLEIRTHPGSLRQNEAYLSERGQQVRDALGRLLKGPRHQTL